MKTRIQLIILAIGMITGTFAQKPTMTLTFTADNNGQPVTLNSILIENLTQGGDTTLYAPDTVLTINYQLGIEGNALTDQNLFHVSQNYPNPIEGSTTIDLYLPGAEDVIITVGDILGSALIQQEYRLARGSHSFTFYAGRGSLYFLTARVNQQTRTIKMFNTPSLSSLSGNCKLEYGGNAGIPERHKATGALNGFVFNLGDQLQYTASSALGDRTIIDAPSGNQTYTFQYGSGGIPCPGMSTVTYEGQVYNTVLIGSQCWLKENLNVGTMINGSQDQTNNGVIEKYCYDNTTASCDVYGGLYQWNEMMQYVTTPGVKGICPDGWHLPTESEWIALTTFLGGWNIAGGKMKETDTLHWSPPNTGATNETGYTALPGGYRYANAIFSSLTYWTIFWSSNEQDSNAWMTYLSYIYATIELSNTIKDYGCSVRCLRDN